MFPEKDIGTTALFLWSKAEKQLADSVDLSGILLQGTAYNLQQTRQSPAISTVRLKVPWGETCKWRIGGVYPGHGLETSKGNDGLRHTLNIPVPSCTGNNMSV